MNYGSKIFEKYLNEFNIPEHSKPLVREIYNRLTEVINVEGRNPHTVCGAAIVLSQEILKSDMSIMDIAERVGIKEATLKQFMKTIEKDKCNIIQSSKQN